MLKIIVVTVGHLKESYLKEAAAEYEKRLSAYCSLKISEIEPARIPENPNETQIDSVLEAESGKILSAIPHGAFVIPLCIEGKQLDSVSFSKKIELLTVGGVSSICFIIGGSHGISDRVKSRADLKLSISEMTFPHQLARIMLLEQIYRAFKISEGGTYHK